MAMTLSVLKYKFVWLALDFLIVVIVLFQSPLRRTRRKNSEQRSRSHFVVYRWLLLFIIHHLLFLDMYKNEGDDDKMYYNEIKEKCVVRIY